MYKMGFVERNHPIFRVSIRLLSPRPINCESSVPYSIGADCNHKRLFGSLSPVQIFDDSSMHCSTSQSLFEMRGQL
jgi:hypothetical protein